MSSVTPRKILVVDDQPDIAQSTAEVLRSLGHSATSLSDARAVIPLVGKDTPDVVLLDIGMPYINGYQIAKILKATYPRVCVVAVTAYEGAEHRERARAAGFDAYLVKPVDVPLLESALGTLFAPVHSAKGERRPRDRGLAASFQ